MTHTYPVRLTQLESLFLSDSISMFMQGPPDSFPAQVSPYPNLLLKIGGAVLETDQQDSAVDVCLSLAELWMIREVAKSTVVVGSEHVGLSLLLKIYEAIRSLTAKPDMDSVVSMFGEVAEEEPGKINYAALLERLKNGGDIRSGGTQDDSNRHKPDNADQDGPNDDPKATS